MAAGLPTCFLATAWEGIVLTPTKTEVRYGFVPRSMYQSVRWSVWKKHNDGRKIPYRVLDNHTWSALDGGCKSNDRSTWVSFKKALECYFMAQGSLTGLTFGLGDGWCGFDFDDVIVDGKLDPQVVSWLARLGGYQEVSQSGNGVKAVLRGTLSKEFLGPAETGRQFKNIPKDGMATEVYDKRRFFFLTGTGVEVSEGNSEAVTSVCAELSMLRPPRKTTSPRPVTQPALDDDLILQAISMSRNKPKFDRLWNGYASDFPSVSEADMALASILMFWCRNNTEQVERLFNRSELGRRDKWAERQDYRERTLRAAVQTEVYRGRAA